MMCSIFFASIGSFEMFGSQIFVIFSYMSMSESMGDKSGKDSLLKSR